MELGALAAMLPILSVPHMRIQFNNRMDKLHDEQSPGHQSTLHSDSHTWHSLRTPSLASTKTIYIDVYPHSNQSNFYPLSPPSHYLMQTQYRFIICLISFRLSPNNTLSYNLLPLSPPSSLPPSILSPLAQLRDSILLKICSPVL